MAIGILEALRFFKPEEGGNHIISGKKGDLQIFLPVAKKVLDTHCTAPGQGSLMVSDRWACCV